MLCVGINLEDFPVVRGLAENHPQVFASVGVHPGEVEGVEPEVSDLTQLADHPRVVAIGETGLDYYYGGDNAARQRERFRVHIRAARETGLPLIVHTRDAAQDTLHLMREERADLVGGVMHCFTGDYETATAAVDLGFYISFSGIVTFKNADDLRQVAARLPMDRLLIETDAPYLTPVPFRGKANQPAYVRYVADCIAAIRNESSETIAITTSKNFFRLFGSKVRRISAVQT
jgi:TatD DNase family protein